MAKKLWSIFGSMDKCLITGIEHHLEHHHIFGGRMGLRPVSEKYGYVVALHESIHPNGAKCKDKNWMELDHWLKRKCQEHFLEIAKIGDRQDWYDTFGRFYDDRCNEKVSINDTFTWDLREGDENGRS